MRVPYYIWDPKRDPNLENLPTCVRRRGWARMDQSYPHKNPLAQTAKPNEHECPWFKDLGF